MQSANRGIRPLKIEMVLPSLVTGGMEAVVARLTRALASRGLELGVTLTEELGVFGEELLSDGFHIDIVEQSHRLSSFRTRALEEHFIARAPDIVHVHSGVWFKAARASRRLPDAAVLHTMHGLFHPEPLLGPLIKRLAMHYTDRVACVSQSLAQYLIDAARVAPKCVTVIPNGIDTDRFRPVDRRFRMRSELGIPNYAFVIGTVARLDPIKNQTMLVTALEKLRARGLDAYLLFVGDGPERGALEGFARDRQVAEFTVFAGRRPVDAELYADLDVFCLPSFLEGTSISLLEAMACGVPSIATSVGGSTALLKDAPVRSLIPTGDDEQLAVLSARFASDFETAKSFARWSRSHVLASYSESGMADAYENVYRELHASAHGLQNGL